MPVFVEAGAGLPPVAPVARQISWGSASFAPGPATRDLRGNRGGAPLLGFDPAGEGPLSPQRCRQAAQVLVCGPMSAVGRRIFEGGVLL